MLNKLAPIPAFPRTRGKEIFITHILNESVRRVAHEFSALRVLDSEWVPQLQWGRSCSALLTPYGVLAAGVPNAASRRLALSAASLIGNFATSSSSIFLPAFDSPISICELAMLSIASGTVGLSG